MDLKYSQPFYDAPTALAARKAIAEAGKSVNILAEYKGFYYINYDKVEGWIPKKSF